MTVGCTPIGGGKVPDNNNYVEVNDTPNTHSPAPVASHKKSKQSVAQPHNETQHWGYDGNQGLEEWSELSPKYALCGQGTRQSPIDITKTTKANLGQIIFKYKSDPKEIINNGHTIQVNMHKGSRIIVNGKTYNLLQFHFHSPSEHMIDGKPADMVAHFVHKSRDGQIAVVAVLMDGCQESKTLSQLWRKLPDKTGSRKRLSRKIKVARLLPRNRKYYQYSGSLTTPPCTEDVNWMILKNPITVSGAQIKSFTEIFGKSVRPVQKKHHRVIKRN